MLFPVKYYCLTLILIIVFFFSNIQYISHLDMTIKKGFKYIPWSYVTQEMGVIFWSHIRRVQNVLGYAYIDLQLDFDYHVDLCCSDIFLVDLMSNF